jgi:hypothetical protein
MHPVIRRLSASVLTGLLPPTLAILALRAELPDDALVALVRFGGLSVTVVLLLALAGRLISSIRHLVSHSEGPKRMATVAIMAAGLGQVMDGSTDPSYLPLSPGSDVSVPVATSAAAAEPPTVIQPPATHTVVGGDNFWVIARAHLESAWGRSPSNDEIGQYWRAVIEDNLDRLRSGDPDLIFPGEVFILPDPGTGG